jgi:hypothetical protein
MRRLAQRLRDAYLGLLLARKRSWRPVIGAAVTLGRLQHNGTVPQTTKFEPPPESRRPPVLTYVLSRASTRRGRP